MDNIAIGVTHFVHLMFNEEQAGHAVDDEVRGSLNLCVCFKCLYPEHRYVKYMHGTQKHHVCVLQ